jgi:hypothetical protein
LQTCSTLNETQNLFPNDIEHEFAHFLNVSPYGLHIVEETSTLISIGEEFREGIP